MWGCTIPLGTVWSLPPPWALFGVSPSQPEHDVSLSNLQTVVGPLAYASGHREMSCDLSLPCMQLSDPLPAGALESAKVVLSGQGETCDATCTKLGKRCSARHMLHLNTCDSLREHVGCEAGCEPGPASGASAAMPLYIDGNAPKGQRPAMCFTAHPETPPGCGGKDAQARRLCACA